MKLPGYMRVMRTEVVNGEVRIQIKIRRWHPGFWLVVLRHLLKGRVMSAENVIYGLLILAFFWALGGLIGQMVKWLGRKVGD